MRKKNKRKKEKTKNLLNKKGDILSSIFKFFFGIGGLGGKEKGKEKEKGEG